MFIYKGNSCCIGNYVWHILVDCFCNFFFFFLSFDVKLVKLGDTTHSKKIFDFFFGSLVRSIALAYPTKRAEWFFNNAINQKWSKKLNLNSVKQLLLAREKSRVENLGNLFPSLHPATRINDSHEKHITWLFTCRKFFEIRKIHTSKCANWL